jgi:hypothetical protein
MDKDTKDCIDILQRENMKNISDINLLLEDFSQLRQWQDKVDSNIENITRHIDMLDRKVLGRINNDNIL